MKTVTVPLSHYNAARRVLKLSQIYFESLGDSLMAADGGYMTGDELANHCEQARKLLPANPAVSGEIPK